MNKKKIIIIGAIALILIVGIIVIVTTQKNSETTKLLNIYNKMKEKNQYAFSVTLDDNNYIETIRDEDKIKVENMRNGEKTTYIVKDGNTYLLVDETKNYFEYLNNSLKLNELLEQLENVIEKEVITGKEKIENKTYYYEEYKNANYFGIKETEDGDAENSTTRFYFNKDKLVYIKTITDQGEELSKVEVNFSETNTSFEIPPEYTNK